VPVHQSGIPRAKALKGIYKSLATVVKMEVRFEPTFCIMATAAIEIKTAIRAYSIAVAPSSLLNSSINTRNIAALLGVCPPVYGLNLANVLSAFAPQNRYRANTKIKAAPSAMSTPAVTKGAVPRFGRDAGGMMVNGRYSL
jgi:hypothetical protein